MRTSCLSYFFTFFFFTNLHAFTPDTNIVQKVSKIQDEEKVEMEIHGFSDYLNGSFTVFLKEKNKKESTFLPIVIGGCEAIALSRELSKEEFPRPLTYPLFCNVLDSLEINLLAVVINDLKDNTFFAVIVLEQSGKRWEIDARPSDAMNLAIRKKCKIFSYRKVIEQAGVQR